MELMMFQRPHPLKMRSDIIINDKLIVSIIRMLMRRGIPLDLKMLIKLLNFQMTTPIIVTQSLRVILKMVSLSNVSHVTKLHPLSEAEKRIQGLKIKEQAITTAASVDELSEVVKKIKLEAPPTTGMKRAGSTHSLDSEYTCIYPLRVSVCPLLIVYIH